MVRRLLMVAAARALSRCPVRAQSDLADVEKVKEMEAQWGAAMVKGDWAAIEKMIAPQYLGTDGAGKRYTKTEYMAMMKTGGMTFSELQTGAENVVLSGNTAVHMGEGTMLVKMPDGTTQPDAHRLDRYVGQGQERQVALHCGPVGRPPGDLTAPAWGGPAVRGRSGATFPPGSA